MDKYTVLVLLFTTVNFQLIFSKPNGFLRPKTPKMDYFKGYCVGHEDVPIQLKNIRVRTINKVFHISGKIVVTQENFTNFEVLLKTHRCASKEALDSCEPIHDVKMKKICNSLNLSNQIWTPFIGSIDPPLGCPAKIGTYVIRNGTFAVGPLINFPGSEDWYWREQAELYDENSDILLGCFNVAGQIIVE